MYVCMTFERLGMKRRTKHEQIFTLMQGIAKIDDPPEDANRMRVHPMRGLTNKNASRNGIPWIPFSPGPLPVAFRHCCFRKSRHVVVRDMGTLDMYLI